MIILFGSAQTRQLGRVFLERAKTLLLSILLMNIGFFMLQAAGFLLNIVVSLPCTETEKSAGSRVPLKPSLAAGACAFVAILSSALLIVSFTNQTQNVFIYKNI